MSSKTQSTAAAAPSYVVVGCKPWNRTVFRERISTLRGRWHFIARRDRLTPAALGRINPRYVFFLHWSWKVPAEIFSAFECVCFHMTDVPYGRGGSPLQNLILRGHRQTRLTALRMTDEMDAGPVYLKRRLDLRGSAQDILVRASELAATMIKTMITRQPTPRAQRGRVTVFHRRRPADSALPENAPAGELYDFIRMLDAEGYPPAFLERGDVRLEFTQARLHRGQLTASVRIVPLNHATP